MFDLFQKVKIYGCSGSLNYALQEIYKFLWMRLGKKSYSQQGEDLIIDRLLSNKEKGFYSEAGFYVDVGAYDPVRFNNTKRFYDRGWVGINIDPNPNLIKKFIIKRKRDVNLILGVGNKNGSCLFYEFFPTTLSTFSQKEAKRYIKKGFRLVVKNKVSVRTLRSVFNEFCNDRQIDFLSVDTEGTDLEVLQSNNWGKFKPKVICVETKGNFGKIAAFLKKYGYQLKHNNRINSIFSV